MFAGDSAASEAAQRGEEAVQQGAAQQAPTPDSTDSYLQSVLFMTFVGVTAGLILLVLTAAVLFTLKTRRRRCQGGRDENSTVRRHLAVGLSLLPYWR